MDNNLLNQVKDKLSSANSIIVLLPPTPDVDSISAAVSLHLSLKSLGKTSVIGCSSDLSNNQIESISEVKKTIGNQKLIISFDYKEENVENVSYDINEANKKFNLIIQPKPGIAPLDPSTVEYTYSGANADLVVTFGINSLEELGKLYSDEKTFLDQAKIVNISSSSRPTTFAELNITTTGKSNSEAVGLILKNLEIALPMEAATNLYRQLVNFSQNFASPSVDADTFELAAYLLRHNAKKVTTPVSPLQPKSIDSAFKPINQIQSQGNGQSKVPPDWQRPKIFKSTPPSGQLR